MFERFRRRRTPTPIAPAPSPSLPDFLLARSVEDVIEILRMTARDIAGADGITVVERVGDTVHYLTEDAVAPLWSGQRFPIRKCVTGMAMLSGTPIVIPDIRMDSRVPLHLYLSTFVRSMAVFPIGRPIFDHALGLYWREVGPADAGALARMAHLATEAGDALAAIAGRGERAA